MQVKSHSGGVIANNRARALATVAALALAVCSGAAYADTVLDFTLVPDGPGSVTGGTLQLTLSAAPNPSNPSETFTNQSSPSPFIDATSDVVVSAGPASNTVDGGADTYNIGPGAGGGYGVVTATFDDGALSNLSFSGNPIRGNSDSHNIISTSSPLVIGVYAGTNNGYSANFVGDLMIEVSAVPLPAALPLFAGGLAAMGLLGRRRKQRQL